MGNFLYLLGPFSCPKMNDAAVENSGKEDWRSWFFKFFEKEKIGKCQWLV